MKKHYVIRNTTSNAMDGVYIREEDEIEDLDAILDLWAERFPKEFFTISLVEKSFPIPDHLFLPNIYYNR